MMGPFSRSLGRTALQVLEACGAAAQGPGDGRADKKKKRRGRKGGRRK